MKLTQNLLQILKKASLATTALTTSLLPIKAQQINLNTVEVQSTRIELNELDLPKQIIVITAEQIAQMPAQSISEVLAYAASIDVRNRGVMDAQADISIRGGSFDQTLILVDGIKMNDPQTGHHAMNLSVAKSQIERIEIIPSGAARLYGAGAFAGAINIITKKERKKELTQEGVEGMHGLFGINTYFNYPTRLGSRSFALNYLRHDGFMKNTDFQNFGFQYKQYWKYKKSQWEAQVGYNQKAFGAQAFYSTRYPFQYEQTRMLTGNAKWKWASDKLSQKVQLYYRGHSDRFELFRQGDGWYQRSNDYFVNSENDTAKFAPGVYYRNHNFHIGQSAGAEYAATYALSKSSRIHFGWESRYESVMSNVLGESMEDRKFFFADSEAFFTAFASRVNHSAYFDYLKQWNKWSLSGGLTLNFNTDFAPAWLPGAELLYKINTKSRAWIGYNQSFRLPTYTDLYYRIGGAQGSILLQPEYAQTTEIGYRYMNSKIQWNISAFTRLGSNLIDWIVTQEEPDLLQAANLTEVWAFGYDSRLSIATGNKYVKNITLISQWQDLQSYQEGFTSLYALDVLQHKHGAIFNLLIYKNLTLNIATRYESRKGSFRNFDNQVIAYPDVWLLDAKIAWTKTKLEIYAEGLNLLDQQYFNRGNIPMPGVWIRGGFIIKII